MALCRLSGGLCAKICRVPGPPTQASLRARPMGTGAHLAQERSHAETVSVALVRTLDEAGSGPVCLLTCTSNYPAAIADSNLRRIPALKQAFPQCQVGLSDHTIGNTAAIAAVALGASVFEKHFKLADDDSSVDAAFSATPNELRDYVRAIDDAWVALGEAKFGAASTAEAQSLQFRRSIYVVANVAEGEVFTRDNVRCIRPGFGLHTKHFDAVLGKRAARDIERGTPLELGLMSD